MQQHGVKDDVELVCRSMRWNWYAGAYDVELVCRSIRGGTDMQEHMMWDWCAGAYAPTYHKL